ncbi:MAG TPA: coagulation factor 5/8 type domain-containing protein, partial [Bacilli bacterium]
MTRRLKKNIQVMVVLLLMFVAILSFNTSAFAAVTISQSGNIVTATNGTITITYDVSIGKGTFKTGGGTTLISNWYSDYKIVGNSTRINSYDTATRSATWVSIGTDGYGTGGYRLTITNTLSSGSTILLYINMYADQSYVIVDMTVNNGTSQQIEIMEPIGANNLDIGSGTDKRIYTSPHNNNFDYGVAPVNNFGNSENGYDRVSGSTLTWSAFNGISHWVTAMFDNTAKQGVIGGAATTVNWKSDQKLAVASTANGPLTGFYLYNTGGTQSGTSVSSDKFFLGYFSDYRTGLETFATAYTVAQPKLAWTGAVPIGYNTWYTYYSFPTADAIYAMTDYFFTHLKALGYNYINLDCCYKGVPGQTANQIW